MAVRVRDTTSVESLVKIDEDFHGWLLDQASALRERRPFALDWDNLAEELDAIAAQQRREVKKHLKKLLLHLLKFRAQPQYLDRHHSWRKSVREAREDIEDLLESSPGVFQGKRDGFVAQCYERARVQASDDTRQPIDIFDKDCPWSFDQIMQPDFFPGVVRKS